MVKYLKNFTAKAFDDFYGRGGAADLADNPVKAEAPVVEKYAAPEDEVVPVGTAEEVLSWVGDDKDRAQKALDAENERSRPRKTVLTELKEILDASN